MLDDGEFIEAVVFENNGKFYEFVDSATIEAIVSEKLDGPDVAKKCTAELEKWLEDNHIRVTDIILIIREVQVTDPNLNQVIK